MISVSERCGNRAASLSLLKEDGAGTVGGVGVGGVGGGPPAARCAFQLCVMSLCSSSYSEWGLQLLTDMLALRSSSYWLVRTELLETVAEIDFRWVSRARRVGEPQPLPSLNRRWKTRSAGASSDAYQVTRVSIGVVCTAAAARLLLDFAPFLECLRTGRGVGFSSSLSHLHVLGGVNKRARTSKTVKLVSLVLV